jgi:hypothetical protein
MDCLDGGYVHGSGPLIHGGIGVSALRTPYETLSDRVQQLLASHGDAWPPRYSASTSDAIAQLIDRIDVLERALREMALEIERRSPGRG